MCVSNLRTLGHTVMNLFGEESESFQHLKLDRCILFNKAELEEEETPMPASLRYLPKSAVQCISDADFNNEIKEEYPDSVQHPPLMKCEAKVSSNKFGPTNSSVELENHKAKRKMNSEENSEVPSSSALDSVEMAATSQENVIEGETKRRRRFTTGAGSRVSDASSLLSNIDLK